jgi:mannose-6-phosphate isomerase-like protein (cupin superfamily)
MSGKVDLRGLAAAVTGAYDNRVVAEINDHVVRLSVMTEPFYWHSHPGSDEMFLVLEGVLRIELPDRTVELAAGEALTVPAGVVHRTSPVGQRSVNLTVERAEAATVTEPAPR